MVSFGRHICYNIITIKHRVTIFQQWLYKTGGWYKFKSKTFIFYWMYDNNKRYIDGIGWNDLGN